MTTITDQPINSDTRLPQPFWAYIVKGRVTTFDGRKIGHVISHSRVRLSRLSFTHGSTMEHFVVKVGGHLYHGRGSESISINLRPYKAPIHLPYRPVA